MIKKTMKEAHNAVLDDSVIKLMKKLDVYPRQCYECKGVYYPHRSESKEQYENRLFCSSICRANYRSETRKIQMRKAEELNNKNNGTL